MNQLLFVLPLLAILYLLVRPIVKGAIYFPSHSRYVDWMVGELRDRGARRVIDLGSGDGRIILALAQAGIEATGYEINPLLVLITRWRIRRAGLGDRASVYWKDLWRAPLGGYDGIIVFGFPNIMRRLGAKLWREAAPGTPVYSVLYAFPDIEPEEKTAGVYCYVVRSAGRDKKPATGYTAVSDSSGSSED